MAGSSSGGDHTASSDAATVDLSCPYCDADAIHQDPKTDEWVDCEFCGGQAGWWDITPEARDKILADFAEFMGHSS